MNVESTAARLQRAHYRLSVVFAYSPEAGLDHPSLWAQLRRARDVASATDAPAALDSYAREIETFCGAVVVSYEPSAALGRVFTSSIGDLARKAFEDLRAAGVHPMAIEECVIRATAARRSSKSRAARRPTPADARRVAQQCYRVASRVERLWNVARKRRVPGARSSEPYNIMRREGERVMRLAPWLDVRRESRHDATFELIDHIRESTGAPHLREVAALLDVDESSLRVYEHRARNTPRRKRLSALADPPEF